MIVLAIDPGSRFTGFAFIKQGENGSLKHLRSGVIRFKGKDFFSRLAHVSKEIQLLIDDIYPDQVAIESLIYVRNPNSLMKLAQTRGAILASLLKTHEGKIFEYAPTQIKQLSTGFGHAGKSIISNLMANYFQIDGSISGDEGDALAIGLTHFLLEKDSF